MEKNSSKLVSDKGILHFMNLSSARRKTGENSSKIVTKILYIELYKIANMCIAWRRGRNMKEFVTSFYLGWASISSKKSP